MSMGEIIALVIIMVIVVALSVCRAYYEEGTGPK